MTTPIPSEQHQIQRLEDIDSYLSAITDSETKVALRAIIQERRDQVLNGYDAGHDAQHGAFHLVLEAERRLGLDMTRREQPSVSWQARLEAAALLLASLEVEAYGAEVTA